jgi:hypothetical protein
MGPSVKEPEHGIKQYFSAVTDLRIPEELLNKDCD